MPSTRGGTLLRLAAFTDDPAGGNPAGVWIGPDLPDAPEMQRMAAEVGYSETAFLAPSSDGSRGGYRVRYFSPLAEVPFCGHATIASGVALVERGAPPDLTLQTNDGRVAVHVAPDAEGRPVATLTSVEPWVRDVEPELLREALGLLDWRAADLRTDLPPAIAFAGARHLVLVARGLDRLATLDYPFEELQQLMLGADLTTVALVVEVGPSCWRARDPFPVGGAVEDPATGAAAAAFGAYLRHHRVITPPASFVIEQGIEMGRPSRLTVSIEPEVPGVRVSGTAVAIA